jgi:hypothetical protein
MRSFISLKMEHLQPGLDMVSDEMNVMLVRLNRRTSTLQAKVQIGSRWYTSAPPHPHSRLRHDPHHDNRIDAP